MGQYRSSVLGGRWTYHTWRSSWHRSCGTLLLPPTNTPVSLLAWLDMCADFGTMPQAEVCHAMQCILHATNLQGICGDLHDRDRLLAMVTALGRPAQETPCKAAGQTKRTVTALPQYIDIQSNDRQPDPTDESRTNFIVVILLRPHVKRLHAEPVERVAQVYSMPVAEASCCCTALHRICREGLRRSDPPPVPALLIGLFTYCSEHASTALFSIAQPHRCKRRGQWRKLLKTTAGWSPTWTLWYGLVPLCMTLKAGARHFTGHGCHSIWAPDVTAILCKLYFLFRKPVIAWLTV